jgi:alpha-1,3-mannosyl-glycoprotein beta-1,2-N-acetylglucosaminyltransferase
MDLKKLYLILVASVVVGLLYFIYHTHDMHRDEPPFRQRHQEKHFAYEYGDDTNFEDNFNVELLPKIVKSAVDTNLFYSNLTNTAIVILTHSRVHYLLETINSLLKLPEMKQFTLIVSQDGDNESVKSALLKNTQLFNERFHKFLHFVNKRDESLHKTSQHIAKHYKFALDMGFITHKFETIIILEEDMVFSPDFLHFFDQTRYLLSDPTVWCISSWNDFGFKPLVSDPSRLFRSQYFPGLGWMTTQSVWREISPIFPTNMWDDFMRSPLVSKKRDCIVPEISRNRNIGAIGANMNAHTYKSKLANVAFYEGTHTNFGNLDYLLYDAYEPLMKEEITHAEPVIGVRGIMSKTLDRKKSYLVTFRTEEQTHFFRSLGIDFGEFRTHHNWASMIRYHGVRVFLAHVKLCPYLPVGIKINKNPSMLPFPSPLGYTCDRVCSVMQKKCLEDQFDYINDCTLLTQFYPCKQCGIQYGDDIPNYVEDPTNEHNGMCLITLAYSPRCSASHPSVKRLCPCG